MWSMPYCGDNSGRRKGAMKLNEQGERVDGKETVSLYNDRGSEGDLGIWVMVSERY